MAENQSVRLSDVRDIARRELSALLEKIPGPKIVAIDPTLRNPLRLLDTPKQIFVKEKGVNGVFIIDDVVGGEKDRLGATSLVVLLRPSIEITKLAAAMIRRFTNVNTRIFFVPKLSLLCSHYLVEDNEALRDKIDKFGLDWFALDDDLLSMELPTAFRDLFVDGDVTPLSLVANALSIFQATSAGRIPKVRAKGYFASKVATILKRLDQDIGDELNDQPSKVAELYIIDRGVDLVTPMMTQLTYEGIIDELYGIDGVDFTAPFEIGQANVATAPGAAAAAAQPGGDRTVRLTSTDRVLDEIRDTHISHVGALLHQKSLSVKSSYDKRKDVQQLKEIKDFMRSLPQIQETHRLLSVHAAICSQVNKASQAPAFRKSVLMEQGIVLQVDDKEAIEYIDEMINRGEPFTKVLRLLCLMSIVNNGLKPKVYEAFKESLMLSYGIPQTMSALYNLERIGLLTRSSGGLLGVASSLGPLAQLASDRPAFSTVKKNARLWVDNPNERNPDDVSYAYSGYAPLLLRVLEDMMRHWDSAPGPQRFSLDAVPGEKAEINHDVEVSSGNAHVVMVMIVGGVTRAEIAAIRQILTGPTGSAAEGDAGSGPARRRFVIATTAITTGKRLLNGVLPFECP